MNRTKIEWCDFTWSPVTGCTPISEGCQNCYAQAMATRFNGDDFKVTLHPEKLDELIQRKKPAKIFVCSVSDLFHDDVPDDFIYKVFLITQRCQQHTFIILTKRPERMKAIMDKRTFSPYSNVWLGVTIENQSRADERIPLLLQTPAAKRFVSVEPMLGQVDLKQVICRNGYGPGTHPGLDWVICGGETGPGARTCEEKWLDVIYDQCVSAQVPFFFKSRGSSWLPRWGVVDRQWEKRREFPK